MTEMHTFLWVWGFGTILTLAGATIAAYVADSDLFAIRPPSIRKEDEISRKWAARVALTAPLWPIWLAIFMVIFVVNALIDLYCWAADKKE